MNMKVLLFLLPMAFCLQFCSYSQTNKKISMDTVNKNNPVYSNTDTSKVNMTDE